MHLGLEGFNKEHRGVLNHSANPITMNFKREEDEDKRRERRRGKRGGIATGSRGGDDDDR